MLDVPTYLFGLAIWREQYAYAVLGLCLSSVFLLVPQHRRSTASDSVPALDIVLAVLALLLCFYTSVYYPQLISDGYAVPGTLGLLKAIAAGAIVLLVIEAVRRVIGLPLVILAAVVIAYGLFADSMPDVIRGQPLQPTQGLIYLQLDPAGILGTPLAVSVTVVLAYIFLGTALFRLGGGRLFVDLALSGMGRFTGGAAKASVLASSLFGTVSGSAVANVVSTGIVTIPLMKASGLSPSRAAAVEAVASTGGQLLPPVMGAAAFIMADLLGIPYAKVALGAAIPALFFYAAVFMQVHLESLKAGIRPLEADERPPAWPVIRDYWPFLIPFAVLIYLLFFTGWQASRAAFVCIALVFGAALISPKVKLTPRVIINVLEDTGRALLEIVPIGAAAEIIIGVLSVTGLTYLFGLDVLAVGGDNLALLLVLAAGAALVLGMGMPTTAVYVLMATLIAPSLIQAGIDPLAAHLYLLYFGVLSMVTPPVCIAAFAGASLAGAPFMRAGLKSAKLAAVAFVVPVLFVASPSLLMKGTVGGILIGTTTGLAGCWCLAVCFVGYLFGPVGWLGRVISGIVGLGFMIPGNAIVFGEWVRWSDLAALTAAVPLFIWLWWKRTTALQPA